LSRDEYKATFHGREFIRKAKEKGFPVELSISLAFLAMRVKDYYLENKIGAYLQLLALALEGVKDEMLDDYDQQCNNNNNQSTINVPGNEHITIDFNCPIPDMASVISFPMNLYPMVSSLNIGRGMGIMSVLGYHSSSKLTAHLNIPKSFVTIWRGEGTAGT